MSAAVHTWHIVTPEYPPQLGGISDYARLVASGLARRGDAVHVWSPSAAGTSPADDGVVVHADAGTFSRAGLARLHDALDRVAGPRRLFVQWVPHGYGYWSMNVGFCLWVLQRARRHHDVVDIMVHEPFLLFRATRPRESAAALVHRIMTMILLQAATRVWYSIPSWEPRWKAYTLGRRVPFRWLPLPSTVPTRPDPATVRAIRESTSPAELMVGHFGTFGADIRALLVDALAAVPPSVPAYRVLLIGPRGPDAARELIERRPDLADRVTVTGPLRPEEAAPYIAACDIMLQPYIDGVSSRRTSFMAGLAMGRAMVTTLGEASEPLWKESGAAMFGTPHDTASLGAAVAQLMTDRSARERLGNAGLDLYRSRFDIDHIIATLRTS